MALRAKGGSGRVTIKTVAEDSGVSVAAVSKVLRNAYGVSAHLRSKVEASIARLGYRPLAVARGMRGQTYTLGLLFSDLRNPFFADIMAGINAALERTQYQPLLGISQFATAIELALVDAMVDRQMDGLILVGSRMRSAEVTAIAERIPTVVVGLHLPEATTLDTVNNDDRLGAALVVRHLVERGRRRIAFLTQMFDDREGTFVTSQREFGYRQAMIEAGLRSQIRVVHADQTARETQTVVRHLLQSRNPPDAIFAWTDLFALQALSVAHDLGLSVPEDVAIVGYDNASYCDLSQNSLTSIDQSGQILGLQAARLLIERIGGREPAEHFVVTPRLVVRGSSMPPAPRALAE